MAKQRKHTDPDILKPAGTTQKFTVTDNSSKKDKDNRATKAATPKKGAGSKKGSGQSVKYKDVSDGEFTKLYDQDTDKFLGMYSNLLLPDGNEVTISAPREDGFWGRYNSRIAGDNNNSLLGAMFMTPVDYAFNLPQALLTNYLTQGQHLDPASAFGMDRYSLAGMGVNMGLDPSNLFGAGLVGDASRAGSILGKTAQVPERILSRLAGEGSLTNARNVKDLKELRAFTKKYGYELPKNIDRIAKSDLLTDRTIRGIMQRHNTFVRGVSTNWDEVNPEVLRRLDEVGIDYRNNPQAAAKYMATHIPGDTGYGRYGLDSSEAGLYTSNSIPTAEGYTYGDGFINWVRRQTDFTSPDRSDWISKNDFDVHRGYFNAPEGASVIKGDARKRIPTSLRELMAMTPLSDPVVSRRAQDKLDMLQNNVGWWDNTPFDDILYRKRFSTDAEYRRWDNVLGEDIPIVRDSPNILDKIQTRVLDTASDAYNLSKRFYRDSYLPAKVIASETVGKRESWKNLASNLLNHDDYAHYIFKGAPDQQVLDFVKSKRVTPDDWGNKSRGHYGNYSEKLSKKQYGGSVTNNDMAKRKLQKYPLGGLTGFSDLLKGFQGSDPSSWMGQMGGLMDNAGLNWWQKIGTRNALESGDPSKLQSFNKALLSGGKDTTAIDQGVGGLLDMFSMLQQFNKPQQPGFDPMQFAASPTRGFQFGGMTDGEPVMEEEMPQHIQTEKGEMIALPDGKIVPVKAKKKHKGMKGDEVTDILPPGSLIASADKRMTFSKSDLKDVVLGFPPIEYREDGTTPMPKEGTAADIMNKNNMKPAEYLSRVRSLFPETSRELDPFAELSRVENLESRDPYITAMKYITAEKKPKDAKVGEARYGYYIPKTQMPENTFMGKLGSQDTIFKNGGQVPKYYLGDLLGALGNIGGGIFSGLNQIGTSYMQMKTTKENRKILNESLKKQGLFTDQLRDSQLQNLGLGSLASAMGILGQDPRVDAAKLDTRYVEAMPQEMPRYITDYAASQIQRSMRPAINYATRNAPSFSRAANMLQSGQADRFNALGNVAMNMGMQNMNMRQNYLGAMSEMSNKQRTMDTEAQNRTRQNRNAQIGGIGNVGGNYFTGVGQAQSNYFGNLMNIENMRATGNMGFNQQMNDAKSGVLTGIAGIGAAGVGGSLNSQQTQMLNNAWNNKPNQNAAGFQTEMPSVNYNPGFRDLSNSMYMSPASDQFNYMGLQGQYAPSAGLNSFNYMNPGSGYMGSQYFIPGQGWRYR